MKRLLILHGPNMNLFGIRSAKRKQIITLDKINRHIRRFIRDKNLEIKIIQTHSESKAVSYIQRNRNFFDGMIITPGPWDFSQPVSCWDFTPHFFYFLLFTSG